MSEASIILLLLTFIPVLIITAFTPYFLRRTESFGVSIPSEVFEHEELKSLRKKFASAMIVIGLICIVPTIMLMKEKEWFIAVAALVYIVLFFLVYIVFHKKMKRMKETNEWFENKQQAIAIDLNFQNKRTIVSNLWFIIGGIMTLVTFVLTIVFYDRIPDIIPMQYDFQGNVTNTAEKSWGAVLALPGTQFGMLILFIFLNAVIARSKQQLDPSNPQVSAQQNLIFRRRWSVFLVMMGHGMLLLFGFLQISLIFSFDPLFIAIASGIVTGGTLIGAIVLAITTGQGGSRVRVAAADPTNKINRDDDRYWKLGIFYYNPDDPAVWLEKRFGIGWTMNMARPTAWLIFLGIIVLLLLPLLLM